MESELVILRPAPRWARLQLLGLLVLGVIGSAVAWAADGLQGALVASSIASLTLLASTLYYSYWLRRRAPRAVVATRQFVGVLELNGQRCYVPWDSVRAATHTTTVRGMRWRLETAAGRVEVLDIGVDPECWGALWRYLWPEVARRGRPVRVDAVSNTLFG